MIDVSELMTDDDFCDSYSIQRPRGFMDEGEWMQDGFETIDTYGPIQPVSAESKLSLMPDGSRLDQGVVCWNNQEMVIDAGEDQRSDVIVYKGQTYRVVAQKDWSANGYWKVWAEGFTA